MTNNYIAIHDPVHKRHDYVFFDDRTREATVAACEQARSAKCDYSRFATLSVWRHASGVSSGIHEIGEMTGVVW